MTMSVRSSILLLLNVLMISGGALAQSPVGRWVTIDDEREEPRSIVSIYEQDGRLFAKVDSIYLREDEPADPVCEKCKGDKKDQPILGMIIMWDMKPRGEKWSGGRILDPEKGKTYRCKIWVKDGRLKVRGYIGPFYRTQTWLPAD
ncbi:MAG: DUF2147 domain-containing protein [Rhodothermales bacterium]